MLAIQKKLSNSFFVLLCLPATAMGTALSVQIAALSWILNTKFGFDVHEIGFVWLAGPLSGILGQVLVGFFSDRVWFLGGRRRPFILIGGFLATLALLALPNIDKITHFFGMSDMVVMALAVALTLDLSINISFNPTRSIIADVTPEGQIRTKGYTWLQTVSGFFGVIAYLIGAFIDNYVLIYVGVVLVFLFSIIPPFFIEEPRFLDKKDDLGEIKTTKETNWAEFLKICLAHAFTWVGVQTMFIYSFSYIKEVIMGFQTTDNLTEAQNNEIGFMTGVAFAIMSTVGFLFPAFVLEPLTKSIGRVRTHTLCVGAMALGYVLLVLFAKSQMVFFLMMMVIGIGWAAVVSLPFAIMSEVIDQRKMGLFMGFFNLAVTIPQVGASGLGAFISYYGDKNIIYIISALMLSISTALWFLVKEQKSEITQMPSGSGH